MIIQAKNFSSRSELETYVLNNFERTVDLKEHEIHGDRDELERLFLSDKNLFWGMRCKILDSPTDPNEQKEKPERGEIHKSGLNLTK